MAQRYGYLAADITENQIVAVYNCRGGRGRSLGDFVQATIAQLEANGLIEINPEDSDTLDDSYLRPQGGEADITLDHAVRELHKRIGRVEARPFGAVRHYILLDGFDELALSDDPNLADSIAKILNSSVAWPVWLGRIALGQKAAIQRAFHNPLDISSAEGVADEQKEVVKKILNGIDRDGPGEITAWFVEESLGIGYIANDPFFASDIVAEANRIIDQARQAGGDEPFTSRESVGKWLLESRAGDGYARYYEQAFTKRWFSPSRPLSGLSWRVWSRSSLPDLKERICGDFRKPPAVVIWTVSTRSRSFDTSAISWKEMRKACTSTPTLSFATSELLAG